MLPKGIYKNYSVPMHHAPNASQVVCVVIMPTMSACTLSSQIDANAVLKEQNTHAQEPSGNLVEQLECPTADFAPLGCQTSLGHKGSTDAGSTPVEAGWWRVEEAMLVTATASLALVARTVPAAAPGLSSLDSRVAYRQTASAWAACFACSSHGYS